MRKVLIGFIAGVTVGLLYAPTKGENSRRKLATIGDNLKEGWETLTDAVAARVNTQKEDKYEQYPYDQPDMVL